MHELDPVGPQRRIVDRPSDSLVRIQRQGRRPPRPTAETPGLTLDSPAGLVSYHQEQRPGVGVICMELLVPRSSTVTTETNRLLKWETRYISPTDFPLRD